MKTWNIYWLGLAAMVGLVPALWAQIPVAPAIPAAPVVPVAAAPVAAPVAAPANLWTFLCPPPEKVAACKAYFCASPFGMMVSNMLKPVALLSGGIAGNCCPTDLPNPADLAKPSDTPAGAAAQIKKDEAAAKARREAVRYLGTVDCHYWPEAQDALINALRMDRNECVRLEAAWALGRGCCCTKKTLVALSITVAGSNRDGNPSENSERVKAAAAASLAHCLACLADTVPLSIEPPPAKGTIPEGPKEGPKEGPPEAPPKLPPISPAAYYEQVQQAPLQDVVSVAHRTLAKANVPLAQGGAADAAHSGAFNIIANAVAANGTRSSGPVSPAKADSAATAQAVSTDPPRDGLLPMLARRFAPTPLNEDQPEGSQFKTPPLFGRRSQPEQVVVQEPEKHVVTHTDGVPSMPTPAPVVKTAPLTAAAPLVTTISAAAPTPSPTTVPVPAPAPGMPTVPPPAPTPVVKTPTLSPVPPVVTTSPPAAAAPPAAKVVLPAAELPVMNAAPVPIVPPPPAPVGNARPAGLPPAPLTPTAWTTPLIIPPSPPAPMENKGLRTEANDQGTPWVAKTTATPAIAAALAPMAPPAPPSPPKQPTSQVVQAAYSVRSQNPPQATPAFSQPRPEFPKYVSDLIETLEHGKACEEALGAAFSLASSPWKTHPRVVDALMTAARVHPLVPVRVTAIRCLVGIRVTTPNVRAALQALKSDSDPAVRSEAEQALNSLVFFLQPGEGRVIR